MRRPTGCPRSSAVDDPGRSSPPTPTPPGHKPRHRSSCRPPPAAAPAGQQAAQRIFWHLTARDDDPSHLTLPIGKDPAELLQTVGATALRDALASSRSLASKLIDDRVQVYADRLDTVEGSVHA